MECFVCTVFGTRNSVYVYTILKKILYIIFHIFELWMGQQVSMGNVFAHS